MTTPDTTAVRAWARDNGYDVADRGRLPAEIFQAYAAAHGKGSTGGRKPAAKKAAGKPAAKAATKRAPAKKTATRSAPKTVAPKPANDSDEKPAAKPDSAAPKPSERTAAGATPSPVAEDRRLVALAEEIKALTKRVEALEKGQPKKEGGKRFRRSR